MHYNSVSFNQCFNSKFKNVLFIITTVDGKYPVRTQRVSGYHCLLNIVLVFIIYVEIRAKTKKPIKLYII